MKRKKITELMECTQNKRKHLFTPKQKDEPRKKTGWIIGITAGVLVLLTGAAIAAAKIRKARKEAMTDGFDDDPAFLTDPDAEVYTEEETEAEEKKVSAEEK